MAPRVSSFCNLGGCVEVDITVTDHVVVRDRKQATYLVRPTLVFTREEWSAFIAGVKNGEFDL